MLFVASIDLLLQYVLSGSDDFNLYMWKIPEEPVDGGYLSPTLDLSLICSDIPVTETRTHTETIAFSKTDT